MDPSQMNWPTQRNKVRWTIVWFGFLLILSALTSCAVQPRYHQRGWHIEFNSRGNQSYNLKKTSHHRAAASVKLTRVNDSLEEMHISPRLINAGKFKKWIYRDTSISKFITKQLRTMTIIGDTFTINGKLVAANNTGIFLYNTHDPLFWVSKKPYGKTQTAIRDKILFVPYTDIQKIKKGGTLASKLERILNGLFWTWFSLSGTLGGFWAIGTFQDSGWLGSDALEVIITVIIIVAFLATLALTVILSIVLAPILFLLQLSVARLKGRYWEINKNNEKGRNFFEFIQRNHLRYRLFRSDINVLPSTKKGRN